MQCRLVRPPVRAAAHTPLVLLAVLICLAAGLGPARADSTGGLRSVPASALNDGGLFFPGDEAGRLLAAPLLDTHVEAEVSGMVVRYRLRHTFRNTGEAWTEAIYTFPLPTDAAVDRLTMEVGERRIDGVIKERAEARAAYETARDEGRRASLVDQERPNIFTTTVANIAPGEAVVVEIGFQDAIPYKDGRFEMRLPLVVGPRYIPGVPVAAAVGGSGWAPDTTRVPDASRVTPPVRHPDSGAANPVAIDVRLTPGFPLAEVSSPSHAIDRSVPESGTTAVTLSEDATPTDRDFILRWVPAASHEPGAGLFSETIDGDPYALLTIMPPTADGLPEDAMPLPREVIFIVDTSGSMEGGSIDQAAAALDLALGRLRPEDRFNVIRFSDQATPVFTRPQPADAESVAAARGQIGRFTASGGTEIVSAVDLALDGQQDATRLRQVVLITDGAVGNEDELARLVRDRLGDSRLFVVGIGSAPNSFLMTRTAAAGRGAFVHVGSLDEVFDRMAELFTKLESPVVTDLAVDWPDGAAETWPDPIPDLYAGEPLTVAARLASLDGTVRISGQIGGRLWDVAMPLSAGRTSTGISAIWARAKIRALIERAQVGRAGEEETEAAVTDVALVHRLVSPYTSLVAIDTVVARPPEAPVDSTVVATNLPDGWDHDAVFGPPPEMRRFDAQPAETQEAMRRVGFGSPTTVAAAPAPMPQTATGAPGYRLLGLALMALAFFAWLAGRRQPA